MSYVQVMGGSVTSTGDETARHTPGSKAVIDGKEYMYVLFDNGTDNVASAAGGTAFWKTMATFTVTSDYSSSIGSGKVNTVAGLFNSIVTDAYYCWIQLKGYTATCVCGASVVTGDLLIASSTDLTVARMQADTAPTNVVVGLALSAVSSSNVKAYLTLN